VVAVIAAVAAVVSTYRVFSNTYDEPAQIATGMEWLSRGSYRYEPQHPPLTRVASAMGPWLVGERSHNDPHMYTEGRRILGRGDHYERTLALARAGTLPFLLALVATVWLWGRRLGDERTAAFAVVFALTNPNLLAHAGIAGNDMGPAALMPAALLAWTLWLESPTTRRSLWLGAIVAGCGLTKFSALAFLLPAAIVVALLAARASPGSFLFISGARRLARPVSIALAVGALVTWATYRFSVGPLGGMPLPAPEFWTGLGDFFRRGARGHPAFLLGEVREGGWLHYDLVAFLVKTPLPVLLLGGLGAWVVREGSPASRTIRWAPLIGIGSVLLVASLTPVDIGIRLILAVYPLLAVLAARGFVWAWAHARNAVHRVAVGALLTWSVLEPVATHPDHLAYFNQLAGPHPEQILVDSNLDWGQDLYRLRHEVQQRGMDSLRIHYFGTAELAAVGLQRVRRLRPNERATGWVAASETFYRGVWADTSLNWLRAYEPVARVGTSIRLYFIAPRP
jgi:hypothetical protein